MSKLENKENKAKKTKKTVAKTVKAVKKAKTKTIEPTVVDENVFSQRLHKHYDELKWLYCELYQDDKQPFAYFDELMKKIKEFYIARPNYLKELDIKREQQPDWYKGNKLLGMMMYVNSFSGTLKNFEKRLPYIQESNVNYLHLMPLLSSPKGKSDGGYAVADFRSVQEELGTMKDLENLAKKCHERGISVCLDFVMNHTSDEHEWARKARSGEKEYQDRYFLCAASLIPN